MLFSCHLLPQEFGQWRRTTDYAMNDDELTNHLNNSERVLSVTDASAYINAAQWQRIERMLHEPIYLIDIKDNGQFMVTGKTGNLYTVTVDPSASTLRTLAACSCPDNLGHARRSGAICKHACFILLKALRLSQTSIFVLQLPRPTMIRDAIDNIRARNWGHLTDEQFQQRYAEFMSLREAAVVSSTEPVAVTSGFALSGKVDVVVDDSCAICLDEMPNPIECLQCPGCKHAFHRECMDIWLEGRSRHHCQPSCPLCRHSWEKYRQEVAKQMHESSQNGGYVNLAEFVHE
jgi:hypothetical protein